MEKTKSLNRVDLPDGKYYAVWFAYTIKIKMPDWEDKHIKVNNGIRGVSNVIIEIIDGWLYVNE